MTKDIVLLDLFSGIGGFPLGLERAGFNITKHYFSEVDKHAISNYRFNFKTAEYVGSVTDVRGAGLPKRPNIITFGSPCQDFSLAGKRKGMDGERSSLISHAIRLITECRPDVFIWENVKGTFSSNNGADFWAIVQAFANIGGYRLEWQLLNTAWLLPQNRERIYLIGHLGKGSGRNVFPFREDDQVFDQPNGADNRRTQAQYCSTIVRPGMGSKADDTFIATALNASSAKMVASDTYIQVKSATAQGYETATEGDSINLSQPDSETRRGRVGHGKAQTLETSCNQAVILGAVTMQRTEEGKKLRSEYEAGEVKHGYNEHREQAIRQDGLTNTLDSSIKSQMVAVCAAMRGRNTENPSSRIKGDHFEQRLEVNQNGTTNTLTAVQKDNLIIQLNPSKESGGNQAVIESSIIDVSIKNEGIREYYETCPTLNSRDYKEPRMVIQSTVLPGRHAVQLNPSAKHQQDRVYSEHGIAPQLNAGTHGNAQHLTKTLVGARIRRLTEIECERLQGFPDNWTKFGTNEKGETITISRTQRYKMCGNAVTVAVVEMIGQRLIKL
jgi:DNA (cytosine-5)-methyltransferase 1